MHQIKGNDMFVTYVTLKDEYENYQSFILQQIKKFNERTKIETSYEADISAN